MPNGHGGYPWMGGPFLLLVLFLAVLFLPIDPESSLSGAREIAGIVIGAFFGCGVAYHLHMRHADAYDGAYTNSDTRKRARTRYLVACVVYGAVGAWLAHWAIEARG